MAYGETGGGIRSDACRSAAFDSAEVDLGPVDKRCK